ncbi:secretion system protein E, partial [Escherichia coli]|nr:secretion system protein E [Escherichia coli]
MSEEHIIARQFLVQTGIQELLDMDDVTEIAVNQPGRIWFEGRDGWCFRDTDKVSYKALMGLAYALCNISGLEDALKPHNPIASVVLPGGERGQIIVPPAT